MNTKIQINSLQALERLIGGDSELEIEVRNSVVQEFAKKHLKTLTQNFAFRDKNEVEKIIQKEVGFILGTTYYNNTIRLNPEAAKNLDYLVEKNY